jgi:2-polyprenyl-3-methyl-5-hydroxy-6-metoxy-1,4-benzoquinol methylase
VLSATDPSGDPLAAARAWLVDGALTPWDQPSRFGPAGRLGRRVLRRLLRPYEIRQREFQRAVVDALALHAGRLETLRAYLEILRDAADRIAERQVAGRRDAAPLLAAARRAIDRRIDALRETLDPDIYLGDPSTFQTVDESGRRLMGFVGEPRSADATLGFLATFRGPEERVCELQHYYVDTFLLGRAPVLDIGCGRGELLDLLRDAGIEAFGVENSPVLIDHCRAKGHRVELADGLDYLASRPDGSLGAVFTAQVIEHLSQEQQFRLFEQARQKLKPEGVLVVETLNPHSLQVLTTFWVDPTHTGPVFPEVALFYCRSAGFAAARILFPSGTGDLETDLRAQNEYAVVASAVPGEIGLQSP